MRSTVSAIAEPASSTQIMDARRIDFMMSSFGSLSGRTPGYGRKLLHSGRFWQDKIPAYQRPAEDGLCARFGGKENRFCRKPRSAIRGSSFGNSRMIDVAVASR